MTFNILPSDSVHDQHLLDIVLARIGFDRGILRSPRTRENTLAKGRIAALLRTARTPQCAQLTWQRIAHVMGSRSHSKVMYLFKVYTRQCGEVSPWNAYTIDVIRHEERNDETIIRQSME
jgi:hypothetical protein